eukprot:TRINITY_DN16676_c0_g1_i3.p1 TRINITY_DN16676_c0_g1~~TRINITY_DN16676_c0_g1_i3.p1  ORF type:complete len:361 (-),score=69.59 TRINITY_DN16676_c0_g1_i3:174-1256(-)
MVCIIGCASLSSSHTPTQHILHTRTTRRPQTHQSQTRPSLHSKERVQMDTISTYMLLSSFILRDFVLSRRHLVIISGAGASTESGVPDYRSPKGSYAKGHRPTNYQEFMTSLYHRQRYWARSMAGWKHFFSVDPNSTHHAVYSLEAMGHISGIITQNVDRLHTKAGSANVIELHGNNETVICTSCKTVSPRLDFQKKLEAVNSMWIQRYGKPGSEDTSNGGTQQPRTTRPDGDVDLGQVDYSSFEVPLCDACAEAPPLDLAPGQARGIIKPTVVFFGENVASNVVEAARDLIRNADGVLVLGTSLMVYSSYRFAKQADELNIPMWMVNIGPTRADGLPNVQGKIEARTGEMLPLILAGTS